MKPIKCWVVQEPPGGNCYTFYPKVYRILVNREKESNDDYYISGDQGEYGDDDYIESPNSGNQMYVGDFLLSDEDVFITKECIIIAKEEYERLKKNDN